jgi:hypothetical protein
MITKNILRLAIVLIVLGLIAIILSFAYLPKITIDDLGKLGGFIGGVIGSTWSIASVLLFLYTILRQREQMEIMKEENEQNKKYIEEQIEIQNKNLKINEFEKKFQALNDLTINALNNFEFDGLKGDEFYKFFVEKLKAQEHLIIDSTDLKEIENTQNILNKENINLQTVEINDYSRIISDYENIKIGFDGHDNSFDLYLTKVSILIRWNLIDNYVNMLKDISDDMVGNFRRKLYYSLTVDQREFVYNCFLKYKQTLKRNSISTDSNYNIERLKYFLEYCFDNVQYPQLCIDKNDNVVTSKYSLEYVDFIKMTTQGKFTPKVKKDWAVIAVPCIPEISFSVSTLRNE